MPKSDDALTIQVEGTAVGIDAEAFAKAIIETVAGLHELDKAMSEFGSETIEWVVVESSMNSPLRTILRGIQIGGKSRVSASVVAGAWVIGLASLAESPVCPTYFTEATLKHAASLVQLFASGVTNVSYSIYDQTAHATHGMAENANRAQKILEHDRIRQLGFRTEYGSLDGILTDLSAQQTKDKIVIMDRMTGVKTRCYFRRPELENTARDAWKRRVELTGEITTDPSGNQQMMVDDIRVFRDRASLPQMRDLLGIDLTNGVEPSDYIRGLRDDG